MFFKYTKTQQILTRNEITSEPLTVLNILPYISVCAAVLMFRHLYGYFATEWVFTERPQLRLSILGSEYFFQIQQLSLLHTA